MRDSSKANTAVLLLIAKLVINIIYKCMIYNAAHFHRTVNICLRLFTKQIRKPKAAYFALSIISALLMRGTFLRI